MSKPTALTEAEIADIEMRLAKGWVIRPFEYRPLIAMARERNKLVLPPQDSTATSIMPA